nr:thioredoxin domain-containing protein [Salidesulfovibrio brasiliensis]
MTKQNALAQEKSPYLLQHAYNPVDWLPWGEAAFDKARREDKPVLVSIGYSTCHWCHVMERESFEDEEIAALLNEAFVCVKVDREERPDVDATYMNVCQMLTGSGGWPLNVLVTADKNRFSPPPTCLPPPRAGAWVSRNSSRASWRYGTTSVNA